MKHATLLAAACVAAVLASPLAAKDIQLPPDAVQLKASPLPGYAKAQANCTMCHSAEYMRMQGELKKRAMQVQPIGFIHEGMLESRRPQKHAPDED